MMAPVTLHGYRFSVYHRIARMALAEKSVAYAVAHVDPFDPALPATWLRMHPFGRVPVLAHGDFHLYETVAITRYIDAAFPGPRLTPAPANALAPDDPSHCHHGQLRLSPACSASLRP
ncbi:MAG: glutathione S-transferase N-terminal domain-containing protein [Pseudomonadota bacterium]